VKHINLIMDLGKKVLEGGQVTKEEALQLAALPDCDLPFLLAMADKIRRHFVGDEVDLCSIVNGRSGLCPENCAFCAQSAHHKAAINVYPLMSADDFVAAAKKAEAGGALRFSIVTSGRGADGDNDFPKIIEALSRIKAETKLEICASLGILSPENAKALVEVGVSRYHHNVETSSGYYDQICTTHTYQERAATIKVAKEAGLELCVGGIIGLGESMADRIDMAFEVKSFDISSMPINILNPIQGTKLADQPALAKREILKTFAIFRFILPACGIRTAGGREYNLGDLQAMALMSGINGMLIGGYLTTSGRQFADDIKMVHDLGLIPLSARDRAEQAK
jgi:biotin synthase